LGEELSVTVTTGEKLPAAVGVPLNTPLVESKVKPAGSPEAAQANGDLPPVTANVVCGYATSTVPFGSDAGVIDSDTLVIVTE